jgi:hypothetical protein
MERLAGFALALVVALAAWAPQAQAAEQRCTTQVANLANPGCGDANRGKILYGQVPGPGVPYTWACNQCHSDNPLTDKLDKPAPAPSLIRAAPRDPGYIQYMMYKQPEAVPIIAAMESCCIADRPPDNVMGDLGDIAEFLYTCKIGIAPCVVGGGGGGGGGGGSPGQLQGSGPLAFGSQPVGTTSPTQTLTLTNVGGATVTVASVASSNPTEFPITGTTCTVLTQTVSCDVTVAFKPSAAGIRTATITVTSDGLYSPQTFDVTGTGAAGGAVNYGGIWWLPSESGWGINFDHQGNTIFATWFTYDATGKAWWLVMTADRQPDGTYTGTLYKTTGSSYASPTFTAGTPVAAGTGTLAFSDGGHGSFASNVGGVVQTKSIERQVFGPLPTCTYSTSPGFAAAKNYQGLWWIAAESGWGINFSHQGTTIFATWFTFDTDGSPLWLVATMEKGVGETFAGTLYRMTATPFGATPFVANTPVAAGTASLAFASGSSASFSYTIGATSRTKSLTRQLFAPPAGTLCN